MYAFSSFGTTVYAHLTPVNPAVFEKLLNSIATLFAPSISYMLCGMFSSCINASYAESNKIIDLFFIAYCTHFESSSFVNTVPSWIVRET